MTLKRNYFLIFAISLAILLIAHPGYVRAGFGVSPARIHNDHLAPGSSFEETIYLSQANPIEPLDVSVSVEPAELKSWVKIEQGEKFIFPQGIHEFPMKVIVNIPTEAGYGVYRGSLTVRAAPQTSKGQITIAIGNQIDLMLNVSGEQFSDFRLMTINIPTMEETWPIKAVIKIENLGNVQTRPSRVWIDVYDNFGDKILKSGEITSMSFVKSFAVGESTGEVDIGKLAVGQYWAGIKIYKFAPGDPTNKEVLVLTDKIRFNVVAEGSLQPMSIFRRIVKFISASLGRIIIATIVGTLAAAGLILWIILKISSWKKRKKA